MSLQLILGGAGSGKTRLLYKNLIRLSEVEPDRNYIAIVPEQFTIQTQKDIVSLHPKHGVMNIDIVSFQRLAYRIFEELAVVNPAVLDDMGKSMVLRRAAAGRKKELVMFKGHLGQNGFISQLKSMISELYQYGVKPETLESIAPEALSPALRQKLCDLSVVYREFQSFIEGRFITVEEILDVLCRVLPRSEMIRNSVITLDGYTGFTPVQYRLIGLFLKYSQRVAVAVTIDPAAGLYREGRPQELFYMSKQTITKLQELCIRNGAKRDQDIVLSGHPAARFAAGALPGDGGTAGALDFLEQNIFRYTGREFLEEPGEIHVFQELNPAREIGEAVRQIQRLVRAEGLRYRDIAVIAGDLSIYANEICHQLESAGIPHFLDHKKSILENPMVELVRAAIETVRLDFTYESVMRYLRTGLVSADREETDRLENYMRATGIRGYRQWDTTWEAVYRGGKNLNLVRLNEFRGEILGPFRELREALAGETTVRSMTEAVVHFLEAGHIEEKMAEWGRFFESRGRYSLAKEYEQIYGLVIGLFERVVGLLGEEKVSKREYAGILDAGFEEIKVGVIPATVDRVVVGDITRTRLNHVKVLFFVGVNDGIVPSRKDRAGLLTDMEKEFLSRHQVELAPTAREEGFMQRFYLYLLLTKPGSRLVVSYAAMDGDGRSLRPSSLIGELKRLFPKLRVQYGPAGGAGREPGSLGEARELLIAGLRDYEEKREDRKFLELCRWFFRSEACSEEAKRLVEAAFYSYERKGIGKAAAKALYGSILSGSVTRLEQYAACAYAHFLRYGLELMERQEYELAAVDIGNLFHSSIDLCFRRMRDYGGDWRELGEADRKRLVKHCVGQAAAEYGNSIMKSSARNAYLTGKLERITDRTVWALAEQMKKGDFVPADFEVSFSAVDNLKAMKIALSEEEALHLQGRIDRLDLCEEGTSVYVKIIDYKSGSTSFDLAALYYGTQLQLVVYMDAVMELEERRHPDKEIIPAGIFYYNISDPLVDKKEEMTPEEIDRQILKTLKMNGLVNSGLEVIRHLDREIENESEVIPVALKNGLIQEAKSSVAGGRRFEALRTYVNEKLRREGKEILSGAVEVNPYKQGNRTACDYCPYHAVCGFDLKTTGYGYRKFKAVPPEEIWPEIEASLSETENKDEMTETEGKEER